MLHLRQNLHFQVIEVVCFDLSAEIIKRFKSLSVDVQDFFSDKVLTLGILIVTNLRLNTPGVILSLHNVSIRGKSGKDWNLVDL